MWIVLSSAIKLFAIHVLDLWIALDDFFFIYELIQTNNPLEKFCLQNRDILIDITT